METLHAAPEISSFVLLAEHQSRTPASFYSGPPVLHYHSKRCKVVILERDLLAVSALRELRDGGGNTAAASTSSSGGVDVNGHENGDGEAQTHDDHEVVVDGVDVWVTSDKFLLYAPSTSAGVSIPYPSILLHAIQRLRLPDAPSRAEESVEGEVQGLYMQIATPSSVRGHHDGMDMDMDENEDEEASITMTIVPSPSSSEGALSSADTPTTADLLAETKPEEEEEETPTQMFYAALSACSNLHPDPVEPGEDNEGGGIGGGIIGGSGLFGSALFQAGLISGGAGDGNGDGLPPPVEGGSGWITAENMHEYFDEEGNWIGPSTAGSVSVPLGPGAGTVRRREDGEEGNDHAQAGGDGVNGDGTGEALNEETKWRRTD